MGWYDACTRAVGFRKEQRRNFFGGCGGESPSNREKNINLQGKLKIKLLL